MSAPSPVQAARTLTELAKQRTHAAAERTLLAWVQNCLMVIGTSVAVNRSFIFLLQVFPSRHSTMVQQIANIGALLFIALGIGLLVLAIRNYQLTVRTIARPHARHLTSHQLITATVTSVILFGVLATVVILLTSLI
jgi:putative membrane protein